MVRQHLIKLKTWLNFSFIFFFLIYFIFIIFNNYYKTNYHYLTTDVSGKIIEIKKKENYHQLIIKTSEKVILRDYNRKEGFQLGDDINCQGVIFKPSSAFVFNLFDYQKYLQSKKIYWIFQCEAIDLIKANDNLFYFLKQKIINRIDQLTYSKEYVSNFILSKNNIEKESLESYKINGTFHLLAISGAHIAFLVLILKKTNLSDKIIIFILFCYLFISSFTTSLLRAVIFFSILYINKKYQLKFPPQKILIYLFIVFLIINPYYIYDIGFLFSFIISFFLITFSYLLNKKNYLYQLLIISTIAFMASFPITIKNFYEINLLSPLINLIFVPLFTIIIYPLSLITFFIPKLDYSLSIIIKITESLSNKISDHAIMLNVAAPSLIVFLIYYILIYFSLKKIKMIIILILFIFFQIQSINNQPYGVITFIDVGQGDAILIEWPYRKKVVLIDTGGLYHQSHFQFLVGQRIIPYLKSRAIKKIDYLVLTHGHYDHIGEAITLLNSFKIEKVLLNSGNINQQEQAIIDYLEFNDSSYSLISEKNINDLYFINDQNISDENEDSLVLYTKINDYRLLFMGDAGHISEEKILKTYDLKIDIIKIGHHGSRHSSSESFIKAIGPQYAIISSGLNNRFNHPHQEVIDILAKNQVKYYNTSNNGSIRFILSPKIKVEVKKGK